MNCSSPRNLHGAEGQFQRELLARLAVASKLDRAADQGVRRVAVRGRPVAGFVMLHKVPQALGEPRPVVDGEQVLEGGIDHVVGEQSEGAFRGGIEQADPPVAVGYDDRVE